MVANIFYQAGGAVGSEVTKALLAAGFIVTAISRKESTSTFPSGIHVQRVNFDSTEELTSALKGQDVVVSASTTAVVTTASQAGLVDAAIAAGVKRFFPSEFGYVSSRMAQDAALAQVLLGKTKTIEYLEEKVKTNLEFSWTGIGTGMFFDWVSDINWSFGNVLVPVTWLNANRASIMALWVSTSAERRQSCSTRATRSFPPPPWRMLVKALLLPSSMSPRRRTRCLR